MSDNQAARWNERYAGTAYAYGEQPNNYLKEQLGKIPVGDILFAAEGEGRNAVYAAQQGWAVSAFDISIEGKNKAMQLAEKKQVTFDYRVGELQTLGYDDEQFDAIALIYAHFPASIKSWYHKTLSRYLRKGGYIIFEAFSKKHLEYIALNEKVGGPKDADVLFSVDEIRSDFAGYNFIELQETEIELNEGLFHNGKGSVIRCLAQKI